MSKIKVYWPYIGSPKSFTMLVRNQVQVSMLSTWNHVGDYKNMVTPILRDNWQSKHSPPLIVTE